MGILFVVALLLAWPTFGLSILIWFALMFFRSASKVAKANRRDEVKDIISPLFAGRHSDFFMALDIPLVHGYQISDEESHQCGRHIMNYLAHNPSEAAIFMKGLDKWRTKGSMSPCDPTTAAEEENRFDAKGEIHLTSYRAIEAIMTNNKSLKCFSKIDYGSIIQNRFSLELEMSKANA